MPREYLIWNATIASLQFWTADLDPITLGRATEEVYLAFFYSTATHTLHQKSDEILFGHFVTTLNAAFEQQLALADECYESASHTINLPTPLRKTPRIHQVSSIKHASFNPDPVTLQNMFQTLPDQYADDYHSVHQMTVTPQKTSPHLLESLHQVHQYA